MVATLLRLRLRILVNTLTREVWRLVFTILGLLYALGMIAGLAITAFFLARAGFDLAGPALLAGILLTLLWVILPLIAFGVDDTLDPSKFAIFTTPTPQFGAGLILAGAVSIPGVLTLGGMLAMTPAWLTSAPAALGWVLSSMIGFLTCLALARLCTTLASTRLRSRRTKDLAAGIGMALLLAAILLPNVVQGSDVRGMWEGIQPVLKVLAWTPLGAVWAAPGALAAGKFGIGVAHLVVGIAWLGIILALWTRALAPAMLMPVHESTQRRKGHGTFNLPAGIHRLVRLPIPAAATAARALRYWRTDPRYFTQAITIIVLPPLLAVVFTLTPDAPLGVATATPVFMAFFAGWAIHNDTAYDSTALWMMIGAGTSGRADRTGRAFAYLAWSLPALIAVTIGVLIFTGQWSHAPVILGASLGIYGAGVGFALTLSAVVVYPVQPPGTSPFSTTGMGSFGATFLTQTIAGIAILVLAFPTLITAVLAFVLAPGWGYVTLAVGTATLVGSLWAGTALGGRVLDERAPAHLAKIRGWSGH